MKIIPFNEEHRIVEEQGRFFTEKLQPESMFLFWLIPAQWQRKVVNYGWYGVLVYHAVSFDSLETATEAIKEDIENEKISLINKIKATLKDTIAACQKARSK